MLYKPFRAAFLGAIVASFFSASAMAQDVEEPPRANDANNSSWLYYKSDLQRSGQTKARLGGIPNLLWRHSTDGTAKANDSSPLVIGPIGQRRVYFCIDRILYCIDGQNGAEIWRSEPLARGVVSPIALLPGDAGDLILAVTSSGQLNALRTSDGRVAWQINSAAPVQNVAPVILKTPAGQRIVLFLANGKLAAFTFDGALDPDWKMRLGSFASSPTATPAISLDDSTLYVPTSDKKLYVVDVAEAKVSSSIVLRSASYESPIVFGDDIIVANGSNLTSLSRENGRSNWTFTVKSPFSAPATSRTADGAKVFVGARSGMFYAVDAADGSKLWEANLSSDVTGAPTVAADMILVGTKSGVLYGLSPNDGRVVWRYRLQSQRVTAKKTTAEDGTETDQVAPENAVNDGPIWDDDATKTYGVTSQPVVFDDQVYLLADNAALYSFTTQPFDAAPPQVSDARLSIPNSAGRPSYQRLDLDKSLLIPGRAPIQLLAEVSDAGSGVDPDSIRVTLNKQPVPLEDMISFSDATGKMVITLARQADLGATQLDDGLYNVVITGTDFRGNAMNYSVNFLVDNTVPAPKAPPKVVE